MPEKVLLKGELVISIPYEEMESAFKVMQLIDEKGLFGVPIILDQDDQRLSVYRAEAETAGGPPEKSVLDRLEGPKVTYLAPVSKRDIAEKVRRRMEEGGHFVFDVPLGDLARCMETFAFLMPTEERFFRFGLRPMDMDYRVVGVQGQEIQPSERSWWQDVSNDPLGPLNRLRRPKAA